MVSLYIDAGAVGLKWALCWGAIIEWRPPLILTGPLKPSTDPGCASEWYVLFSIKPYPSARLIRCEAGTVSEAARPRSQSSLRLSYTVECSSRLKRPRAFVFVDALCRLHLADYFTLFGKNETKLTYSLFFLSVAAFSSRVTAGIPVSLPNLLSRPVSFAKAVPFGFCAQTSDM